VHYYKKHITHFLSIIDKYDVMINLRGQLITR